MDSVSILLLAALALLLLGVGSVWIALRTGSEIFFFFAVFLFFFSAICVESAYRRATARENAVALFQKRRSAVTEESL